MTLLAHRDLNMFVWELLVCSGVCMVFWAVSVAPPEDWKMKPAAKLWGRIDLFLRAALKKKKKKKGHLQLGFMNNVQTMLNQSASSSVLYDI